MTRLRTATVITLTLLVVGFLIGVGIGIGRRVADPAGDWRADQTRIAHALCEATDPYNVPGCLNRLDGRGTP